MATGALGTEILETMKPLFFKVKNGGMFFLLMAMFTGAFPAAAQSFFPTPPLPVGLQPYCVAVADVNGDGKMDLISANYGDNTLIVLTNSGKGVFIAASTNAVGGGPDSVAAADVNGDGKPDLISVNYADDTLMVLTNNGDGTFTASSTNGVGSFPFNVAVADVNGDGKLDLICANTGANTLTVLTNDGDGTFTVSATVTVGNSPSVAAADVNGDGKPDLISANYTDNTVTVLTNNGDGTFTFSSTTTNSGGSLPFYVAAADVNGDGTPDLISANYSDNTLAVLLNLPALKIQSASAGTALVSWSPAWPGYLLQQNTNVATANWANVTNSTGTNRITISPATGNNFFRLRHP
jgi:hypothetical protein